MTRAARAFLAFALVLVGASAGAQELNLNRDLARLGIGADLEPNRPAVDSRPSFQAAMDYLRRQRFTSVTLDPGDYYFLTPRQSDRYTHISGVSDVRFDFTGANFYFREAYGGHALSIADCERVTFAGFTIDFLELPFTQVQVAQVHPESRTIRFASMPGFRAATDFNTVRGPNNAAPTLHGIVFRNGTVVSDTGRFAIDGAVASNSLAVRDDGYWTAPATLARYQAGDTLVIFGRGSVGTTIRVVDGRDVAFEDIDVYASNQVAVLLENVPGARLERVTVRPRPGTDRLISANADGLHLGYAQQGSVIRDSKVRGTLDDGIAVNSPFLAAVTEMTGSSRVTVERAARKRFENGLAVSFVNTTTAEELSGGVIVSQDPSYDSAPVFEGTVRLALDRGLPMLRSGYGMVYTDASRRGDGTLVENNIVEDVFYARGIYIAGVSGVTVRNNIVRRTASGGIVAWQPLRAPFTVPPVRDLFIIGNTIEQPIGVGTIATGSWGAFGGITVVSASSTYQFVTTRANRHIVITGNRISGSGRSGIWVANVADLTVRDNVIAGFNLRPAVPIVGVAIAEHAQLEREFAQSVVVRSSDGVDVANNTQRLPAVTP